MNIGRAIPLIASAVAIGTAWLALTYLSSLRAAETAPRQVTIATHNRAAQPRERSNGRRGKAAQFVLKVQNDSAPAPTIQLVPPPAPVPAVGWAAPRGFSSPGALVVGDKVLDRAPTH